MFFSVHHYYDRKTKSHVPPENNIITAWVEVGIFDLFFLASRFPLLLPAAFVTVFCKLVQRLNKLYYTATRRTFARR